MESSSARSRAFRCGLHSSRLWLRIYQIKYLRRIKVVDRYYMTYDDYGHINPDSKVAALTHMIGPKSAGNLSLPAASSLSGLGFYEVSGFCVVRRRRHPWR